MVETDPLVVEDLDRLIDPATRGDPESPLRWTSKSLGKLRVALVGMGHEISERTLGKLLKAQGFRLQADQKTREGSQHPDRDAQFEHINETVKTALAEGRPVISMDSKHKGLVGDYKNGGREWEPSGKPVQVQGPHLPQGSQRPSPTGGTTSPTTRGMCRSVCPRKRPSSPWPASRAWWEHLGRERFPNANRLTITADCGGGNTHACTCGRSSCRSSPTRLGLSFELCHFPPGTSKWNKVEHRLFSFISLNWRGRPLESYEVILDLDHLDHHQHWAEGLRPPGPDHLHQRHQGHRGEGDRRKMNITGHDWHPEWNYRISPAGHSPVTRFHIY